MKTTRKLLFVCAVFTAIALLFTASALAAEEYELDVADNAVTFSHTVDLFNANYGTYYGPKITFTYAIDSASVTSYTVTDASGNAANVKAGPADAVSFEDFSENTTPVHIGKIVYDPTAVPTEATQTYSSDGTAFTKDITLYFEMTAFDNPGIYRYKLTDTTAVADLYAAGIVRPSTYDKELYLDVYVVNDGEGLKVSSAVLVPDNESIDSEDNAGKPDGFDGDQYYTFDFELSKEVTGTMGDKTHPFEFTITVNNNGLPYFRDKIDSDDENVTTPVETTDTSFTVKLKHGETFKLYGLCDKATVNVSEKNDTSDTYTVTVTSTGKEDAWATQDVAPSEELAMAAKDQPISTYNSANSATDVSTAPSANPVDEVKYTNDLDSVSPTGLALRYGPFVLLLAGAACFFLIGRRRKESDEGSDRI